MTRCAMPLDDETFAGLMTAFAPFERAPRLALAVSGGADSMALALLGARWAATGGGEAVALIVDHGLRDGSAAEAALVARRCAALGLEARVLTWCGPRPARAIEEAARQARYRLLEEACVERGVLHLLLAHHADDQAETIRMRRDMASGPSGLAGMSACLERPGLRLLRPFLGVAKRRLVATVERHGLAWVEDPMNLDQRFARARLRAGGTTVPADGRAGRARVAFEARLVAALVAVATVDRFGAGRLDRKRWRALEPELRPAVLARLALAVGGGIYGPRGGRLERLARLVAADRPVAATLAGCLWRARDVRLTVSRELRHVPAGMALAPGRACRWDGRFLVETAGDGLQVGPLGADGCRSLARSGRIGPIDTSAAAALPAFRDLEGLAAVPHLGSVRNRFVPHCVAWFAPCQTFAPVPFSVGGMQTTAAGHGTPALPC